ncbi:MAG: bifunctional YncE family protein/alkaline phosphatase family protein [Bacteroidota bacterium]|nr:bifunctional YncE family protein/alkaline phosphatase family protein [Bacteroidota bacterium]
MRRVLFVFMALFTCFLGFSQTLTQLQSNRVMLPNGWSLTPVGKSLPLGDLPLNIVVSPSQKYLAVTNNGQSTQTLQLIDIQQQKILDSVVIAKAWLGLAFSKDEKYLYASGGNDNWILQYELQHQKLVLKDSITLGKKWPEKISPAGLCIDDRKHVLYVVTKENNSLYIVDLLSKKVINQIQLPGEAYTCLLSPDKKELYITCWGAAKILVYAVDKAMITDEIAVGSNPNDLCMTKNGHYIFVANANDNSVSVVDVHQRKTIETLNAALYPDAPTGSTTNAVALSADEKTLYVANADNNCLAVFDVSKTGNARSKGFIPVGWYPTSIKVIGKNIFVANGKGFSSMANPFGPDPYKRKTQMGYQKGLMNKPREVQYIGGLFKGTLSIIPTPTEKQLSVYSQAVYSNTPYNKSKELVTVGEEGNPIPHKVGDPSPIKYVFYIIKENRTYDQVLGDLPQGNGDKNLCLFGEKITPNLHAIAKEFVLLDNFYADGEVSADGHNWSLGAYATDYLEKTWVTSYGGRGGSYDAEGNRAIANNKKGFIWDHAKRAGVSYRTYGEFADNYKPNIPVLKDHFCPYFTSWDQKVRDTTRVGQWKRDFDSLVAANALPQLNTLRLINDHTEGLNLGRPTPAAHCADNDLAVGMFIEHLSKSPVWKESVVFIVEDDAQNGPDHVDAHRTTAYVAGGFVKRGFVDHTMYSTSSMLRTIELILGIPPMSQYDAAATPMWHSFQSTADEKGFVAKPLGWDINEKNTAVNAWQQMSEKFDFSKEDRVPDRQLTEVIWKAMKGVGAVVPAPKRAAFVKSNTQEEDD